MRLKILYKDWKKNIKRHHIFLKCWKIFMHFNMYITNLYEVLLLQYHI